MTRQKAIYRICEDCGEDKRTTVYEDEESVYYCEECQKRTAMIAYNQSSPKKGMILVFGFLFIGLAIGFFVCKLVF